MVDKNDCLECGSGKCLIISTEFSDLLYCKNCSLLKKKNLFNQKKKLSLLRNLTEMWSKKLIQSISKNKF